jgi:heme/copper-type cytochrome/quinol oxidase subunit 3
VRAMRRGYVNRNQHKPQNNSHHHLHMKGQGTLLSLLHLFIWLDQSLFSHTFIHTFPPFLSSPYEHHQKPVPSLKQPPYPSISPFIFLFSEGVAMMPACHMEMTLVLPSDMVGSPVLAFQRIRVVSPQGRSEG